MMLARILPALLLACSFAAHAIEEPAYTVVQRHDAFEVRRYAPFIVAEVIVQGEPDEAGNQGFRILADYIFGKNKGERTVEVNPPMVRIPVPTRIEMTAPVTLIPAPSGFAVQFMMPAGSTLASLPEPVDQRISLRELPARSFAVIRYSGSWSQENYREHLDKLTAALALAGLKTEGEPVFSRYNSPFSIPFFRRNEIWLALP